MILYDLVVYDFIHFLEILSMIGLNILKRRVSKTNLCLRTISTDITIITKGFLLVSK